jgi:predicted ester cyclase
VEEMIAEDDQVVVRVSFTGTHQGEFLGVPPTQRKVTVAGVELARLEDGKIEEEAWHSLDEMGLLRQLGALRLASE